jgi:26S proteasome non-ATPase regulatory subunit 9
MAKVEIAVHEQFARLAAEGPSSLPTRPAPSDTPRATPNAASTRSSIPFAKVSGVVSQSPADIAGLEVGDEIVQFGPVNWQNHDNLRKVSETVTSNEGVSMPAVCGNVLTANTIHSDMCRCPYCEAQTP